MNIKTECHGWDNWTAIDADTYDGAIDSRSPVGYGHSEQEAIDDLKSELEEVNCFDEEAWLDKECK